VVETLKEETEAGVLKIITLPQARLTHRQRPILLHELILHPEAMLHLEVIHHLLRGVTQAEVMIPVTEVDPEEEDNKMKKNFLTELFLLLLVITFTGCYTIVWNPSDNTFPGKNNNVEENEFYPETYYGNYSDFYGNPWWYDITVPGYTLSNKPENGNTVIRDLGGRGERTRDIWNMIVTDPPARNSNDQSGNLIRTNSNNSSNTNSNSRSEANRSSQNSNNTRNENGSRNTDNGRGR
jgi:hypothetical protein